MRRSCWTWIVTVIARAAAQTENFDQEQGSRIVKYGPFNTYTPTDEPLNSIPAPADLSIVPVVQLSIFIKNIEMIDGRSGHWIGDIILTHMFQVADFKTPKQEPTLAITNGKTTEIIEDRRTPSADGKTVVVTQRLMSKLNFEGDYNIFPFDTQNLDLQVAVQGLDANQVRLAKYVGLADGIRPIAKDTQRHFKVAQFRVIGWSVEFGDTIATFGMPYRKSLATLKIQMQRYVPYYFMSCIVLPISAVIFALAAFLLPVTQVMPRVMMTFVAFLSEFVHFKWLTTLVPVGMWCWLFTEMCFFMAVLSMAILMNIMSSVIALKHPHLSERHDRLLRWSLPSTLLIGGVLLMVFKEHHIYFGAGLVICVMAYYVCCAILTYREAKLDRLAEPGSCQYYCLCECFLPVLAQLDGEDDMDMMESSEDAHVYVEMGSKSKYIDQEDGAQDHGEVFHG